MHLIIVESPTKAKTIKNFLTKKYQIIASGGHIRNLPKGKIGVEINDKINIQYVIPTKNRKTVSLMKKEVIKAEKIILATDQDREGEAIAWHLSQILNLESSKSPSPITQRIIFNEITKSAIETAIKNPKKINMNLVNAQQTRRVLDRIVGYNLSPFLWKKIFKGLSAGRVQSVALKMIVDREKEITKFNKQEYWNITATLLKTKNQKPKPKNSKFEALLIQKDNKKIPQLGIKTEVEASKIIEDLKKANYKVISIQKKEIKKNPLPPFTTSTLQQTAAQKLGFSAKFTMQLAQKLYETGLITYHRTDSLNQSEQFLLKTKTFINQRYGQPYCLGIKRYKTQKRSQAAHEAIRPTSLENNPERLDNKKLNPQQLKLYQLIWNRSIASQMEPAIFNAVTADIQAKNYLFRANGQILKFDGFLRVYDSKYEENQLPELAINEILKLIKLTPQQHFTKPPSRYNEATLIKALEENEIGRPSTYAQILSTIQTRGYVEKKDKQLIPTENGMIVNNLLTENFSDIINIKFTAQIEKDLDQIAQGKKKWQETIKDFYFPFIKNLNMKNEKITKIYQDQETNEICTKCSNKMIIKTGRFGKFLACSNFPTCKYTKSIEKPKQSKLNIKCPKCIDGEMITKKTKKGKVFYACDQWPNCDFALWDEPINEKCLKCKSLLVKTKKNQIKCSNKECTNKD